MIATSSGVVLSPGLARFTSAPRVDQRPRRRDAALPRRKVQRRQSALRADQLVVTIAAGHAGNIDCVRRAARRAPAGTPAAVLQRRASAP